MIVTVRELIRELREFPPEWEIWMEVRGREAQLRGISTETGGVTTWVLLSDYPDKHEEDK